MAATLDARVEAAVERIERSIAKQAEKLAHLHDMYLRMAAIAAERTQGPAQAALLALAPDGQLVEASGFFDARWYLERYPDVDEGRIDPVVHYINVGAKEGRDPGPHFSTRWYLATYPDVAKSGANPLVHYLKYGIVEGRQIASPGAAVKPDKALAKFRDHPLGSKRLGEMLGSPDALSLFLSFEFDDATAARVIEIAAQTGDEETPLDLLRERVSAVAALAPPTQAEPEISILVPVHNEIRHTIACLHSLFLFPPSRPFEVLIGDDGSTDGTEELLNGTISGVKLVRHASNLGFLRNCNAVVDEAAGDMLVLFNNDTILTPGAVDELTETLAREVGTGLVGSRLVYPDGSLQEAGCFVFENGSGWNYGRDGDPLDPAFNYRRETDYCSAAAVAIPTGLWRDLDGFDERYAPAYYEDTDLAMRVREAGYKVVYQPRSIVLHFEGKSHGVEGEGGLKRFQKINRETFRQRWAGVLSDYGPCDPKDLPVARGTKAHILVVDAEIPRPDSDSGSADAFEYLRLMVEDGYRVTFVPENLARSDPYTADLNRVGVETLFHPYWSSLEQVFAEIGPKVDLVMMVRAPVAARVLPLVREYAPEAKLVFNTVDLHFLRMAREAELAGDPSAAEEARRMRDAELSLISAADATIVVSEHEAELLRQMAPKARVAVVPVMRPSPAAVSNATFDQRKGIVFVGGFRHTPNVDAVTWFAREVWPLLKSKGFVDDFSIVGSQMPEDFKHLKKSRHQADRFRRRSKRNLFRASALRCTAPLWRWREREGGLQSQLWCARCGNVGRC